MQASFYRVTPGTYSAVAVNISKDPSDTDHFYSAQEPDDAPISIDDYWQFHLIFERCELPLTNTVQGELHPLGGLSAFDSDHYIAYLSVASVELIAARLSDLGSEGFFSLYLDHDIKSSSAEKDFRTLNRIYCDAASVRSELMIVIA
jgi:hypothetical protein